MGIARFAIWIVVCHALSAQAKAAGLTIAISIVDSVNRPAPGIRLDLRSKPSDLVLATAITDAKGQASFSDLERRPYDVSINKGGFEALRREIDLSMGESATI